MRACDLCKKTIVDKMLWEWKVEGMSICSTCYANKTTWCERCEKDFFVKSLTLVSDVEGYYCKDCIKEYRKKG